MSFVGVAFLFALPLVAAPLLLHLFDRRRNEVIQWGAMQFLMEASTRKTSARRLKQWLLLLLRCLALAALVLALARPLLPSGYLGANDRSETILVIDNSMSMSRKSDAGTMFDTAKQRAAQIVGELSSDEDIRILTTAPYPTWAETATGNGGDRNRTRIKQQLDELEATEGGSDLLAALFTAVQVEHEPTQSARRIVVLTDGQATDWRMEDEAGWKRLQEVLQDAPIRTQIETVRLDQSASTPGLGNVSIDRVAIDRLVVGVDWPVEAIATLRNGGPKDVDSAELIWMIDGETQGRQTVESIENEQTLEAKWRYAFNATGTYRISCRIDRDDDLPADNTASMVVEVVDRIPIVIVEGAIELAEIQQDGYFVQAALGWIDGEPLSASSIYVPTLVTADELPTIDLSKQRVVVIPNLTRLSEDAVGVLTDFVNEGGGLWIGLGPRTDVDYFNHQLFADASGLAPLRIDRIVDAIPTGGNAGVDANDESIEAVNHQTRIDPFRSDHPATKRLADNEQLDLASTQIRRHFRFAIGDDAEGLSVLVRLSDGSPLAVENFVGAGRVIVQALPLRLQWSDLARTQSFVVMVRDWIEYLAEPRATQYNLEPGQPIVYRVSDSDVSSVGIDAREDALTALLQTPRRESIELTAQPRDEVTEFRSSRTRLPGAYRLEKRIDGAEFGLLVADFRNDARGGDFVKRVRDAMQRAVEADSNDTKGQVWPMDVLVLSAFCLRRDDLRTDAVRCLAVAFERLRSGGDRAVRACLRRSYFLGLDLEAFAKAGGDVNSTRELADRIPLIESASLKHWISFGVEDATKRVEEQIVHVDPIWLTHEDHVLHAYGGDIDFLCFRYPLVGNFRFSFDGQDGGRDAMASGLLWNGLSHRVGGYRSGAIYSLNSPDKVDQLEWPNPFVIHQTAAQFNEFALEVDQRRSTTYVNGQTMWSEDAVGAAAKTNEISNFTSPWIGFRCASEFAPLMRNLKITGDARIPREVPLLDADLRGWIASWYSHSRPPAFAGAVAAKVGAERPRETSGGLGAIGNLLKGAMSISAPSPTDDWSLKEGVLSRNRQPESSKDAITPSRFYYMRPMQNGESIRYEFRSKDGVHFHPTIGRIAYVVREDGIGLRWIVSPEAAWTGLSADNFIIDPLARRGSRPIPLIDGEWNRMTVSIADDTLRILLNDSLVLQRKLEPDNGRQFGFLADRNDESLEVRNVILSGDWPETLSEEIVEHLAAPRREATSWQRQALTDSFGDFYLAENVAAVRRRAQAMTPEKRYEFLSRWVLPSDERDTFRLSGHFSPLSPAPPVAQYTAEESTRLANAIQTGESRVLVGGSLFSAAFDLIDAARQTEQLDELRKRLLSLESKGAASDPFAPNERARVAMLALVAIADGSFVEANEYLVRLCEVAKSKPIRNPAERWPEMLAIWEGIRHPETYHAVAETLHQYVHRDLHRGPGTGLEVWNRQLFALTGFNSLADAADRSVDEYFQPLGLKQWSPASFDWAYIRGSGMPGARWIAEDRGVFQMAGQENDFVYFQSPLRGNFEVDCLTTTFDYRECEMFFGGRWAGPAWGMTHYARGDHRRGYSKPALVKPMATNVGRWFHIRIESADGVGRMFANGRLLFEHSLPANGDPWIGARSWHRYHGGIRDVRITGTPEIPDAITMLHDEALTGWADYYDVQNFASLTNWHFDGEVLTSLPVRSPVNANYQRLLRYHRPMIEDGRIEYDFFYQPGTLHVSPVLDRLAMIVDRDAVRIHWCTDGAYDRTGLSPLNVSDEPQGQLAGGKVPLIENAWNRMKLVLVGNEVELVLNDQPIFQRTLEPSNMRRFGLFHFPGQTEARVRNLVWTGEWPKQLPGLQDQELADVEFLSELDRQAAAMQSVQVDFAGGREVPATFQKRLDTTGGAVSVYQVTKDGLQSIQQGKTADSYRFQALAAPHRLQGDFDIVVEFDRLQMDQVKEQEKFLGISLSAGLESASATRIFFHARRNSNGHIYLDAVSEDKHEDGSSRWDTQVFPQEATTGRLRLARRGTNVYYLFASADSDQFRLYRLYRTQSLTDSPLKAGSIELQTVTWGVGSTSVVWKSLTLRAEEMSAD